MRPTRSGVSAKIVPSDSSFIAIATSKIIGENKISRISEKQMSIALLARP